MKIIDTTLREGGQAPNVYFSMEEVRIVASRLAKYGVDCIEVGHPYCNAYEMSKTKAVTSLGVDVPILTHARAKKSDIDAAKESGADWVGIFIGINELSRIHKYNNREIDEILNIIEESINYAKSVGLKVRFTLEDASRTPFELQKLAYQKAVDSNVDRICYSDTVGRLDPESTINEISALRNLFKSVEIEIHFHNDRGLALANAYVVKDMVDWVSCSVNGIGERCGIVDTISMHENLVEAGTRFSRKISDGKKLGTIVDSFTRSHSGERHPITGRYAFTHCADLHIKAVKRDINSYCWIKDFEGQEIAEIYRPEVEGFINDNPPVISAEELRYHRKGPGDRYLLMDSRMTRHSKQYCIARRISDYCENYPSYVDQHIHRCDSLFLFLGSEDDYRGLTVEVMLDNEVFQLESPASVLIPAGKVHTYKVIKGSGTFINHVLDESYEKSLLDLEEILNTMSSQNG